MKKLLLFLCLMLFGVSAFAGEKILNIYNWSGYLPDDVITDFQKETGIKVNVSAFDSNQELYTKIKSDSRGTYDFIVPTSYVVQQMAKEGLLLKLDKSRLVYFKDLNPKLLNQSYDPNNIYSIPYLWGTTGLILNRQIYPPGSIQTWKDLWTAKVKTKISLVDDLRDTFAMTMKTLGYSVNDTNPAHIKQAYLKLQMLMPKVQSFEAAGSQQVYVNEDADIGVMMSGDSNMVINENPNYYYWYPKDGPLIWIDSMAIPKNAPHLDNAYRFINFLMRPDIAARISMGVGFSSPNLAALKHMPKAMQENRILNPRDEDLLRGETEGYFNNTIMRTYLKYWELLKLG